MAAVFPSSLWPDHTVCHVFIVIEGVSTIECAWNLLHVVQFFVGHLRSEQAETILVHDTSELTKNSTLRPCLGLPGAKRLTVP